MGKRLDHNNDSTDEIDFTCRKECGERKVSDTITDVKDAIKRLPKRYFKAESTAVDMMVEGTRTGMKTLVGQIQRFKRRKSVKKSESSNLKLILLIGGFLVFIGVLTVLYFVL